MKHRSELKVTKTGVTLESSRFSLASLLGSRDNASDLYSGGDRVRISTGTPAIVIFFFSYYSLQRNARLYLNQATTASFYTLSN
jgi:hypothetical protein